MNANSDATAALFSVFAALVLPSFSNFVAKSHF
jgi:Tfp pilus assembly protein PilE